jgi:hypothetical protein
LVRPREREVAQREGFARHNDPTMLVSRFEPLIPVLEMLLLLLLLLL